jgi:hypothetical protein
MEEGPILTIPNWLSDHTKPKDLTLKDLINP